MDRLKELYLKILKIVTKFIKKLISLTTYNQPQKAGFMFSFIIPGAIGLGIYLLSRRKKALSNIAYIFGIPSRLKISKGNFLGRVPLTFDNASPQNLTAGNIYLRLEYNGKPIGNLSYPSQVVIIDRNKTLVELAAIINTGQLALALGSQILTTGQFTVKGVKALGIVTASGVNIYIDETLNFSFESMF